MNFFHLLRTRIRPACIHLLVSSLILGCVLLWVFLVWFPTPLDNMLKIDRFFWIIVLVDLCLGPLVILVIYDVGKPKKELLLDYIIVTLIQFSVLLYGLYTLAQSRPVYIVFVKDRLEVVVARDLDREWLGQSKQQRYKQLPLLGPDQLCSNIPTSAEEITEVLESGYDIQYQPKYYRPCNMYELVDNGYSLSRLLSIVSSKQKTAYAARFKDAEMRLQELSESTNFVWLPVVSHYGYWVSLISKKDGQVVEYLNVDPF